MKICYYELLNVESTADENELKKAFRKKALQYHPDKNPENVEESTEIFAKIRAAYEVLSDPQERAWYDSHKQQILSDDPIIDDDSYEYEVDASVTGITTDELLMFFNSSLYTRIDDSPAGIYQIAGKVFARLARDEVYTGQRNGNKHFDSYNDIEFEQDINTIGYNLACQKNLANIISDEKNLFPPFGNSTTDYDHLKEFYKTWSKFGTLKTFSWKDEYMYSKNYDRRTKREINKRNEKARQVAKNEYNKTVKRFVSFIKKLDKRMKDGIKKAEEIKRTEERQKHQALRDAYLNERKKERERNQFEIQSWQTVDEENFHELEKTYAEIYETAKDGKETNQLEEEIIIYDCYLCNKKFKSENQLENHCMTKLHRKNLRDIQKELQRDSMTLGLDELSDLDDFDSAIESIVLSDNDQDNFDNERSSFQDINEELADIEKKLAELTSDNESLSDTSLLEESAAVHTEIDENDEFDFFWEDSNATKGIGSKSQNHFNVQDDSCVTCGEIFESRSKLFKHIASSGHAATRNDVKVSINKSKKMNKKNKKNKKNKRN